MIMRAVLCLTVTLLCTGCAQLELFGPYQARSDRLEVGQSMVEATAIAGEPLRSHEDGTREAWEYCHRGVFVDEYLVIWFDETRVVGSDVVYDYEMGPCRRAFEGFSWDQAPGGGG